MAGKTITLLNDTQWPKSGFDFALPIRPESAALGVIDVQGYVLDVDGHLAHTVRQHSAELQREYYARAETMIGNIQKLLAAFRESERRVFYTRHGAQLPDGSDLVLRRARASWYWIRTPAVPSTPRPSICFCGTWASTPWC